MMSELHEVTDEMFLSYFKQNYCYYYYYCFAFSNNRT